MIVGSGATWKKVRNILDKHNRSISVMQSDNIFSVGGSVSVNVHGWQVGMPPIASTILDMKILTAEGQIIKISPVQDPELFRAVIGGYGLFGVIIEVTFITLPNNLLQYNAKFMPADEFAKNYKKFVTKNPKAELAYGRLLVDKKHLFEEVGLFWYERSNRQNGSDINRQPLKEESLIAIKRGVFRFSQYTNIGKKVRWLAEKKYSLIRAKGKAISRNNAMNADIHILWPLYGDNKDILHEYFVPKNKLNDFLSLFKRQVIKFDMNILNVTIREVKKDDISMLPFAKEDMFALVCLFSQKQNQQNETKMENFTKSILDDLLKLDGTFYLPYRLHYSQDQLLNAYPDLPNWLKYKKQIDPELVFDSKFYQYIVKYNQSELN
ncbi:MAG: FAD-binding oxidoreductase, partial [Rickettsiaceae bacterium]|nr:FAD-binding oxidoreductase [Rickettsiaceae bacterium]